MADNSDYTHIHAHSEWSLLDGCGTIENVAKAAKQKGFRALSQTEHGNVSGAIKFYKACKANDVKAIPGCEIYVVDDPAWRKPEGIKESEKRYHTIVLAKDWNGFVSLQNLLSKAHSEKGFYYKPRVGWSDVYELKNCIVTSACVSGPLKHPDYQNRIKEYREAFGDDFYFEVQFHNFDAQFENNRKALEQSKLCGSKLVVSNYLHYPDEEDCYAQQALLGLRDKKTESDDNRWDMTPGLFMRNYDQMLDAWEVLNKNADYTNVITKEMAIDGLLRTAEIVDKCNFKLPEFEVDLPNVDTSDVGTDDPDAALYELCMRGWKRRFANKTADLHVYSKRLTKELDTVFRLKFSKYFLLVWDLYRFCDQNGIFYGPGRGSGAGSLICYLLGITNADPIHYGLIFERFVNPERIDLPDLDLDFEHERRDEVFRYMQRTYKHVAHIATYNGMNAKMALKDICRYKDVPLEVIEPVCKEMDMNTSKQDKAKLKIQTLEDNPQRYPLYKLFADKNYAVVKVAKVLEGQVRSTGIHAGGVIVSSKPLVERCVLEYRKGDVTINWDMYDIGDMGLLKVDVLGSKTVSILKHSIELIKATRHDIVEFKLDDIPLDDQYTLNEFNKGETTGVFQFESDGIRHMLRQMAPHNVDTIITANAMYRPGPLQFKDLYIKNKKNPELIKSTDNEALDRITKETFGVFIYQEQVMSICVEVAGYTYPEADTLRKKISKSKGKDEVEKDRPKFVDGCVSFGKLSKEVAERIFDEIVDFGRYCFNKSHSTTYSLVSYYAMWLRTHFPCEFLAASIAVASDSSERNLLKNEAARMGVLYMPPDINKSVANCSVEMADTKRILRGGFNELDGIGNAVIEIVLKTRSDKPFSSFEEFMQRLENKRVVNVGVQEKLLKSNTFKSLHNDTDAKRLLTELRAPKTKAKPKDKTPEPEVDLTWLLTES